MARARARFAFRLLACVVVALAVGGGVAYVLLAKGMRDAVETAALQKVQRTADQAARATASADVAAKLEAILQPFATDPDVVAAGVVDDAANPLIMQSFLDDTARRAGVQALRTGRPIVQEAVREDATRVQQIASPEGEYAVVVELRPRDVQPFVDAIAPSLLKAGVPAAALVVLLVWLLGGRRLAEAHVTAIERATRDGLTDLGNHRAFQDDLRRAAAGADRSGEDFGLLLLDLDDFKRLNDDQGHHAGDELLRRVAAALREAVREEDRAFRIGGDEFAVLLPRASEDDAAVVGHRVHEALEAVGAAASLGVGATRPGMRDGAQLRDEVDAAAYDAKGRADRRVVRVSEVAADLGTRDRAKAEALWRLVRDDRLDVAFQPIWDLEAGRLVGVEALARIPSDTGIAGPAEAFEIAERAGFGARMDRVCATRALRSAAGGALPPGVLLFVNLTAETLADAAGVPWLADELAVLGLDPDGVVIEISERFGRRPHAVVRGATELRRAGFRLALDDVGAGDAGLTRLQALELDFVKADRAVTAAAADERGARAVLSAVAAYARATGAFVIAEGIEDAAVLEAVRRLGEPPVPDATMIRGGQGFGLVEPQPTLGLALAAMPGLALGGGVDSVRACSPSAASTT
jgi:diguanylate cyclase (GGDEF)-like protein